MNKISSTLIFFIFASACTPALPSKDIEPELKKYQKQIEESAKKSEDLLKQAKAERETSERILQEARILSEKVKAAQRHCQKLVAEVKLKPPKKVYIIKKVPVEPKQAKAPSEAKTPVATPEHSPSDAP